MIRFLILASLALGLVFPSVQAAPVPVGKGDQIVELPVPDTTMVLVQVNGVNEIRERLTKLVKAGDPEYAAEAEKSLDSMLKDLLEGRDLKALDPKGRLLVAIGDLSKIAGGANPPIAFVLPVPDYKTFREKFLTAAERKSFEKGKDGIDAFEADGNAGTSYLVEKAGNVIFTQDKAVAEEYAGKFDRLTAKQLGSVKESFLNSDLGVFLNVSAVNEKFGQQIQQFKQLFNVIIQQGGMGLDRRQLDAAKVVFAGLFQAIEDGKNLAIALEFRPEGFNVRLEMQFAADSPSGKVVAEGKPNPLASMNALPKGSSSYSAIQSGKGLAGVFARLNREFQPADGEDKSQEAITALSELLDKLDAETVTASNDGGSSLTVIRTKDATKLSEATVRVLKTLGEGASYSNVQVKAKPKLTEADQKLGDFSFTLAKVELDFEATAKSIPDENLKQASIESMKKLIPEKLNIWLGSDGKTFIKVVAKDWAEAKKLIEGFTGQDGKVSADPAFASMRKQLPTNATWMMAYEMTSMITTLSDYMSTMLGQVPGFPGELPKLKAPKGLPAAFLGTSLTNTADTFRLDLFVPAAGIKIARKAAETEK